MTNTTNLSIALLATGQAQKEVTINEALIRLDALLNTGALDKDLNIPPSSPATGDLYIVAASPTGDWSGKAGWITYFDQIWRFVQPKEGMTLWVRDENKMYTFDGTNWKGNNITDPLIIGQLGFNNAASTATTSASFSASHYLSLQCNGVTYYLPLATAVW